MRLSNSAPNLVDLARRRQPPRKRQEEVLNRRMALVETGKFIAATPVQTVIAKKCESITSEPQQSAKAAASEIGYMHLVAALKWLPERRYEDWVRLLGSDSGFSVWFDTVRHQYGLTSSDTLRPCIEDFDVAMANTFQDLISNAAPRIRYELTKTHSSFVS